MASSSSSSTGSATGGSSTGPVTRVVYLVALIVLVVLFGLWREHKHLSEPSLHTFDQQHLREAAAENYDVSDTADGGLGSAAAAFEEEEATVESSSAVVLSSQASSSASQLQQSLGKLDALLDKHDTLLSDEVIKARSDADKVDAELAMAGEESGESAAGSSARTGYGKPSATRDVDGGGADFDHASANDADEHAHRAHGQARHAATTTHVPAHTRHGPRGAGDHHMRVTKKLAQCYGSTRVKNEEVFGEDGPRSVQLDRSRTGRHRPSLLPHVHQMHALIDFMPTYVKHSVFETVESEHAVPESLKQEAFLAGGFHTINKHGLPKLPDRQTVSQILQRRLGISLENIARVQHPNRVSCAIVGAAGHLVHGSETGAGGVKYGKRIDAHDVVIRFNAAPTRGFEAFVGKKTTVRVVSSKWAAEYAKGDSFAHARITSLPIEPNVTFMISPGMNAATSSLPMSKRLAYEKLVDAAKSARRNDVAILKFSRRTHDRARHLLNAYRDCLHWQGFSYDGGDTPSLGLVSTLAFKDMCKTVTLFGFGSPPKMRGSSRIPYQYYSNLAIVESTKTADQSTSPHTEILLLKTLSMESFINVCSWSGRCLIGETAKAYFFEAQDNAAAEREDKGGFGDPKRSALSNIGIYSSWL
ncbi:glycosyltransferase family 29 protein [Pseudoscourfieldia marina]